MTVRRKSDLEGTEARGSATPRNNIELVRALVGSTPAIRRVRELVAQVAVTEATVLITGETGTGKEVAARNVHWQSVRRHGPFVPVNCGALPGELLESELFGHERGAFTGAITARPGRFELADGGTLFLDEIGEMPPHMQVKLLRVLQDGIVERVGSQTCKRVDVRILAATNRDLADMVARGLFRPDLFYRLNVFPIEMPPLRERVEDLPLLAAEIGDRLGAVRRVRPQLSDEAMASMQRYHWPGNVRELGNVLERLAVLYPDDLIEVRHLPEYLRFSRPAAEPAASCPISATVPLAAGAPAEQSAAALRLPAEGLDLKQYVSDIERVLIEQALRASQGVVAHAAQLLGLRRTTLVEKMRRLGMHEPAEPAVDRVGRREGVGSLGHVVEARGLAP